MIIVGEVFPYFLGFSCLLITQIYWIFSLIGYDFQDLALFRFALSIYPFLAVRNLFLERFSIQMEKAIPLHEERFGWLLFDLVITVIPVGAALYIQDPLGLSILAIGVAFCLLAPVKKRWVLASMVGALFHAKASDVEPVLGHILLFGILSLLTLFGRSD